MAALRLLAVLAHPDDETLGFGGVLARSAAEGIETFLVTATRGEGGRHCGVRPGEDRHPGSDVLGELRESELRAAAAALGLHGVSQLGYPDGRLDGADPSDVLARLVAEIRRCRPHVVTTFAPDGAYGHPDHVAISQLTTAACMAAGHADGPSGTGSPHAVSKLYYLAWPASMWTAYERAFHVLGSTVDGVQRRPVPWPDWAITTVVDTRAAAPAVWRAVACHASQVAGYGTLTRLEADERDALWSRQHFYRAYSLVNGGRRVELDLFEGLRP